MNEYPGRLVAREAGAPSLADRIGVMYARHSAAATRFAVVLTGDEEIARDLVQEAFVRVMAQIGKSRDEPRSFQAYLRRAILNLWRSRLRRRKLERRHLATHPAEEASSQDLDTREALWQALMSLPVRQRTAVFLKYYEDLPVAEIAEHLGCSQGAARSLLLNGMRKLRKHEGVGDAI